MLHFMLSKVLYLRRRGDLQKLLHVQQIFALFASSEVTQFLYFSMWSPCLSKTVLGTLNNA